MSLRNAQRSWEGWGREKKKMRSFLLVTKEFTKNGKTTKLVENTSNQDPL
jgi:hypothetical protein